MRKIIVVLALIALAPAHARAEVLADGSYAPTGNAAIDVALTVVNAMNQEIKAQQDLQQVFINRAKLEKALDARMTQLTANAVEIHKLRAQALTEADKLKKGKADRLRDAGGDKAKEAALEEQAAAREAELKKAADELNAAEKALKEAGGFAKQMRGTLHQLGTRRDDKQALDDWEKGGRHNFMVAQQKMQARLDAFGAAVSSAGARIGKGSALDASHEAVGNFTAKLISISGKKTELWIDGQKVEAGADPVPLHGNQLELRAVLVDPRRKQSREIKTKHVEVSKSTDYELSYSLGTKRSDWKVTKEEYAWKEPTTRTGAKVMVARSSSGSPKDDTLEITFSADAASETIRGSVDGDITWKNGAVEETDSESAGYEIQIAPRR
jgi:hypothetical protein